MKNLNADFLLDIWADLKAKRLAPVAVGLAVALVAIPALMLKGEETPAAGPLPVIPAASGRRRAEVELAEELAEGGSKLDSYKAHDPFDGLVKPQEDNGRERHRGRAGRRCRGRSPARELSNDARRRRRLVPVRTTTPALRPWAAG